jgi:hypothetical protein
LAEKLENPENEKRFRELKGEDPDEEALQAKIQVLEERLNSKKEELLEKELILDEVTTLAEKLREQALEGRQASLELSERVTPFPPLYNPSLVKFSLKQTEKHHQKNDGCYLRAIDVPSHCNQTLPGTRSTVTYL